MTADEFKNLTRIAVQRWFSETPQIDNGTCAVCHRPARYWSNNRPGKCPNPECLSNAFAKLL